MSTNKLQSELPDTQSFPESRGLAVTRAGVSRLVLPAAVVDVDGSCCRTVAQFDLGVEVRATQRGTHMSRLVESAHDLAKELPLARLDSALLRMLARMDAPSGRIHCRFPWFVTKNAPATGLSSQSDLDVEIWAYLTADGKMPSVQLRLHVPVTTLCPCSKNISRYGAHNQRSRVSVTMRAHRQPSIAQIAAAIDGEASCAVYAVLKREDEKIVTESAYENPKFAEDLVRDVFLAMRRLADPEYLSVATENQESIHNHSAYAVIDQVHLPIEQLMGGS
ncbi:MAG: GTP cyclohydrolase FolE2 [Nevskiales bacterium]|nr:GTP cyclohydrolase FolE2 [Nevskiales bacterium]